MEEEANSAIDNNKHFAVLIITEGDLHLSQLNKQRENQCKYRDNLNEFSTRQKMYFFREQHWQNFPQPENIVLNKEF